MTAPLESFSLSFGRASVRVDLTVTCSKSVVVDPDGGVTTMAELMAVKAAEVVAHEFGWPGEIDWDDE